MKLNYLLFALALLATGFTYQADAQVVTPKPTPTLITTAPYHITQSGFYQLGANLTAPGTGTYPDAIVYVEANNVTLDLGGHFISGPVDPSTDLYGVYSSEKANINVQNGTISHCFAGVELDGNNQSTTQNINQRVTNLLIKSCYGVGVNLNGAAYSLVNNCRISFIGGATSQGNQGYAFGVNVTGTGKGNQVNSNLVTDINAGATYGAGILGQNGTVYVSGNTVDTVTGGPNNGSSFGINSTTFVVGNQINNCNTGVNFYTAGIYSNNLTLNCTTPFSGGTDAGGNH